MKCPYCKEGEIKVADEGFSLYCDNDKCGMIWEECTMGDFAEGTIKERRLQ